MISKQRATLLLSLLGLAGACGVDGGPSSADTNETDGPVGTEGEAAGGTDPSGSGSGTSIGSSTTNDSDDDSTAETGDASSGGETDPPSGCVPPPLLRLEDIPDNPSLNPGDDEIVATFEVDGHDLIGKYVVDAAAAEGGLRLWQEFTLRVPANQLLDLVQLDISLDDDPVAYFNRTGDVTTSRLGLKIGFSVESFELNQADPCAPLEPRRGTFDWSLIHEFGHLRGFVDGSWFRFLDTFPDVQGDGEGYPEDGSPILTGDFVTSYAERDDGDEDYAESWTTYVMLAASELPAPTDDEPLALQKVRWMDAQPDLHELREAIRISEADAMAADVPPAPRLDPSIFDPDEPNSEIVVPPELHGVWREGPADGYAVTLSADDVVLAQFEAGVEVERLSLAEAQDSDGLEYFELHDGSAELAYSYIEVGATFRANHDFYLDDPQTITFAQEHLDLETSELVYLPDVVLTKVP